MSSDRSGDRTLPGITRLRAMRESQMATSKAYPAGRTQEAGPAPQPATQDSVQADPGDSGGLPPSAVTPDPTWPSGAVLSVPEAYQAAFSGVALEASGSTFKVRARP